MKEETDLVPIRILSYALGGMLVVFPLLAVFFTACAVVFRGENGFLKGIYSFESLLAYICQAVVLGCLYQMGTKERDFRWAQTFFTAWFLLHLYSQIILWLRGSVGGSGIGRYLSISLFLLKDLSLVAGLALILHGLEGMGKEMVGNRAVDGLERGRKLWVRLQGVRLSFLSVCYFLFPVAGMSGAWAEDGKKGLSAVFAVLFFTGYFLLSGGTVCFGIRVFQKVMETCKDYYRYAYNRSLGLLIESFSYYSQPNVI